MSDISSKVISIIVDKLNVEESEVTNEASFTNDSQISIQLNFMEFEKEFTLLFLMIKQKVFKLLEMLFHTLKKRSWLPIYFYTKNGIKKSCYRYGA